MGCVRESQSAISKSAASSSLLGKNAHWLPPSVCFLPPRRHTVILISLLRTTESPTFTLEAPMCSQHQLWFLKRSIELLGRQDNDSFVFTVLTRQTDRFDKRGGSLLYSETPSMALSSPGVWNSQDPTELHVAVGKPWMGFMRTSSYILVLGKICLSVPVFRFL